MTRRHTAYSATLLAVIAALACIALGVELADHTPTVTTTTPTATQFADVLETTVNEYAAAHDRVERIANVHCVKADSTHYMCSYLAHEATRTTCHLAQMTWTPEARSSYEVTLAGRAGRCANVRDALATLQS